MTGNNYIIIGSSPWQSAYYGIQRIATELSANNTVLYVNPVTSPERHHLSYHQRNLHNATTHSIRQMKENLAVFYPALPMWNTSEQQSELLFRILSKINAQKLAEAIKWAIRIMYLETFILVIDNDALLTVHLPSMLHPDKLLYYRSVVVLHPEHSNNLFKHLERRQIEQAGAILATSDLVARLVKPYNQATYNIGSCINSLTGEPDGFSWQECMSKIYEIVGSVNKYGESDHHKADKEREIIV